MLPNKSLTRAARCTGVVPRVVGRSACDEKPASARALLRLHTNAATLCVVHYLFSSIPVDETGNRKIF